MFLSECTAEMISNAAQTLKDGALVAFPTETVYGLGADATSAKAVARIYEVKGRPADHPLIVHIASMDSIGDWAIDIPEYAIKLARDYWPGPMTLILKRSELAQDFITGNQNTVGLRVPAQPIALALLKEFAKLGGKGIAAPSANRFGAVSPTTAAAVMDELIPFLNIDVDRILDGGPCLVGVESTIIDCTKSAPQILRPGAITKEMIEETTGLAVVSDEKTEIRVSGALDSHYSPKAQVVINAMAESGEGFIALATITTPSGALRLAAPNTVEQYARDLYAALREGDARELTKIAVILPQGDGLAEAIRDRITKAAHGD
ncbi:MAG: L-threonylcarbamoyladenylate synthase [Actinobacteria bacterium]|nr:L-threonylcarbamoyladenylate synthase [Actinomycetota bacterium]